MGLHVTWLAVTIFGTASTELRKRITHSMVSIWGYNEMIIMTKHRAVQRDMELIQQVYIKIYLRPAAGHIQAN